MYVPFGSHVLLVFGSFFGRKFSVFRGIEQETEDFLLEFGGLLGEVLHLVEGIAEVVHRGGLRRIGFPDAVGELQEDVLETVGHGFAGLILAEPVAVDDTALS